jgi:hypothetical protein
MRTTTSSRARHRAPILALLVAIFISSSVAAEIDAVMSRGLAHTTDDRELVEQAIDRANLILASTGQHLEPSWRLGAASASGSGVIVYLVASPQGASSTPAAVPRGCACVFVNPSMLAGWTRVHSTGTGRMELDRSMLLTFMLLHEAGHLAGGHSAGDFAKGEFSQLNIDRSIAKADEEKADEFAAALVRDLIQPTKVSDVSLAANWVALELTKLSWNMQAYRSLDEFGAAATGKPAVFFDQGYSHPNLAWRMLRSNYLIQQTSDTRQLLEAFEQARERGAHPQPLYSRPTK